MDAMARALIGSRRRRCALAGLVCLLSLGLGAASPAAVVAAKVIRVTGRGLAATPSGDIRNLTRGGTVRSGETMITGPSTFMQLEFTDGAAMTLRPNTRFVIDEYAHNPRKPARGRSFFSLLKGGFRTITGAVARLRKKSYRVRTRFATIGIRGTDFSTFVCAGAACPPGVAPGMWTTVRAGSTSVTNLTGTRIMVPGQTMRVGGPNLPAVMMDAWPAALEVRSCPGAS